MNEETKPTVVTPTAQNQTAPVEKKHTDTMHPQKDAEKHDDK